MKVRNKQYPVSDSYGRWTDAYDEVCPCRSCYHPHNFGYSSQVGGHIIEMRCLTRELGGCPDILPMADHIYTKYGAVCKRCGHHLVKGDKGKMSIPDKKGLTALKHLEPSSESGISQEILEIHKILNILIEGMGKINETQQETQQYLIPITKVLDALFDINEGKEK